MKKKLLISLFFSLLLTVIVTRQVMADICMPTRRMNMWTCIGFDTTRSELTCGTSTTNFCDYLSACSAQCTDNPHECVRCSYTVVETISGEKCEVWTEDVNCTDEANGCRYPQKVYNCRTVSNNCLKQEDPDTFRCWIEGDGDHRACSDGSCVTVSGDGVNECSSNDECGGGGGDSYLRCEGLSCVTKAVDEGIHCSSSADCVPSYDISGGVYLDDTGSRDKSNPVANAGIVTITGQPLGVVGGDGLYSISGVPDGESYAALLSGLNPLYTCDDPNDCELSITLNGSNVTDADYFVTTEREAWWQSVGGDVGSKRVLLDVHQGVLVF